MKLKLTYIWHVILNDRFDFSYTCGSVRLIYPIGNTMD
jgi:hypothetical protein